MGLNGVIQQMIQNAAILFVLFGLIIIGVVNIPVSFFGMGMNHGKNQHGMLMCVTIIGDYNLGGSRKEITRRRVNITATIDVVANQLCMHQ